MTKNPIAKNLNKFNKPNVKQSKIKAAKEKEDADLIMQTKRENASKTRKRRSVEDL